MEPRWKARFAAITGAIVAVVAGWAIANGNFFLPGLAAAVGAAAIIVMLSGLALDTLLVGALLIGYVVGNRGFAQFSVVPGLPLLPAETGLGVCTAWLVFRSAFEKRLPWQSDLLNLAVLLWLVVGSVRIIPDVRAYGVIALRDFAMVYYAVFFFVGQALGAKAVNARFLNRCLLVATLAVIPLFELFDRFPEFFLTKLVIGGIPVIFLKGDLVATFMALAVVFTHLRWEKTRRLGWLIVALLGTVGVLLSENRASLLGLLGATAWLAVRRHGALLRTQVAGVALALLVLLGSVVIGATSLRRNLGVEIYERIASIADLSERRSYVSPDAELKGGNNQFRLVWWRSVIDETIEGNPWFGLGFGYDLADAFVRQYYPDSDEEFSIRSPHSIIVTAFGRMGLLGLLVLLGIIAVMSAKTRRALDGPNYLEPAAGNWLAAWVILVSACFGVVLEGPMGAVIFWTALGMANATPRDSAAVIPSEAEPAELVETAAE